jgi:cell wall-associated NlpC family hydrolase
MAGTRGIPGNAVAAVGAGALLVWTGITGTPTVDALRELLGGRPASRLGTGTAFAKGTAAGGAVSSGTAPTSRAGRIVQVARKYLGVPYKWAGNTPAGWDCSGYVTYVLREAGVTPPGGRPTSGTYLLWPGARTVPTFDVQAGDLLCWAGHVALASSSTTMCEAPGRGKKTREVKIRKTGLTVRRIT